MAKLTFTLDIAAPADRVAAFFVPQRMPYWYGAEMNAEFEVQGGAADFQNGQKVKIAGRLAGKEVSLTAVVTRYEWGKILEWQFKDAYGIRGLQRWEIAATSAGARVTMYDEYELPAAGLLSRLADALLMKRSVSRRDRSWLARLKRCAENKP